MSKVLARVTLLALLLSISISAKFLLNDYIVTPKAATVIETMSEELTAKTGIHAYVVATKEKFKIGANLYEYSKRFESNISKPYVIFIFAPNALIIKDIEEKGRLGLLASSNDIKKLYNPSDVKKFAVDILKSNDSNSLQAKYDLSVVQAYSELADELASSRGVELSTTLKDKYSWIISIFRWIVRLGTLVLLWIFLVRPIYIRMKNGK